MTVAHRTLVMDQDTILGSVQTWNKKAFPVPKGLQSKMRDNRGMQAGGGVLRNNETILVSLLGCGLSTSAA